MISFKIVFDKSLLEEYDMSIDEALNIVADKLFEYNIISFYEGGDTFVADSGVNQVNGALAFQKIAGKFDWFKDCVKSADMIYQKYIYDQDDMKQLWDGSFKPNL